MKEVTHADQDQRLDLPSDYIFDNGNGIFIELKRENLKKVKLETKHI